MAKYGVPGYRLPRKHLDGEINRIGVFYDSADEALAANGFAPNRKGANQGFLRKPD